VRKSPFSMMLFLLAKKNRNSCVRCWSPLRKEQCTGNDQGRHPCAVCRSSELVRKSIATEATATKTDRRCTPTGGTPSVRCRRRGLCFLRQAVSTGKRRHTRGFFEDPALHRSVLERPVRDQPAPWSCFEPIAPSYRTQRLRRRVKALDP